MNLMELARSALAKHPDNDVMYGASARPNNTLPELESVTASDDPASARRRRKVMAMLADDPKLRIALAVSDPDSDPVLVTIGLRHVAVGELEIPAIAYNPAVLLELLDQHSGARP